MTESEKSRIRTWIECWRRAGPELEKMRREDIRGGDTRRFVEICSGMLEATHKRMPQPESSGLVEQQALFRKMR